MSSETREKIRQARKNRTKQPREGQSNKSKTFYDILKSDYKDLIKKNPEIAQWFKDNRKELSDDSMQHGILNEYEEMYISWREFKLSNIIFGKNAANYEENICKEDDHDFEDEEIVYENLMTEDIYIEYD